jgi:hypothetical protein
MGTKRFAHFRKVLASVGLLFMMGTAGAHDYAVGQVWSYHTRAGEETSVLQINKIEQDRKLGPIFHISVYGIYIPAAHMKGGAVTELPHLPVSKLTLDNSVESLMAIPTRPVNLEEGYVTWKQAFDAGNAGIYTITVAEIVGTAQLMLAKAAPP